MGTFPDHLYLCVCVCVNRTSPCPLFSFSAPYLLISFHVLEFISILLMCLLTRILKNLFSPLEGELHEDQSHVCLVVIRPQPGREQSSVSPGRLLVGRVKNYVTDRDSP